MKRRQIPDGYVSSFSSHTDPAIAEPPPPIIEQKEAETLMGHCLKEFIKERMYGNMININRKSDGKPLSFTPFINSIQEETVNSHVRSSSSMANSEQHRKLSKVRESIEKRMVKRYDSIVNSTNSRLQQQRGTYRHSLGDIEESLLSDNHRYKSNRSVLSNKNKMFDHHDTEKSYDNQMEKYKNSSFISALDQDFKLSNSRNKQKKLSPIPSNNRLSQKLDKMKSNSTKPAAVIGSPGRIQWQKYTINSTFWQLVCKKPKKQDIQLDNSIAKMLSRDQSSSQVENKSMLTMISGKSNTQLQNIPSLDKSKYFLTKEKFSKELYFDYLNNSKNAVKSIANFVSQFFEVSGRVHDDMKNQEYKQMMQMVTTAGPRVWAVCAYRYWDTDLNSLIDSTDIFKIFKELDSIKTFLQQNHTEHQQLNGYKIVSSLLTTVDKLRQIILQQKFDDDLRGNTANKSIEQNSFEIKYLEESILRKKDLKYSDLTLILGQNIKSQVKESKKSVIETTREIRIKMSSCYRYSFLATDHNEQTREDREHIQTLKQSLKKQKMDLVQIENQNQFINKKLPGINYTTFVEKMLYEPLKEIAYLVFGIQTF